MQTDAEADEVQMLLPEAAPASVVMAHLEWSLLVRKSTPTTRIEITLNTCTRVHANTLVARRSVDYRYSNRVHEYEYLFCLQLLLYLQSLLY